MRGPPHRMAGSALSPARRATGSNPGACGGRKRGDAPQSDAWWRWRLGGEALGYRLGIEGLARQSLWLPPLKQTALFGSRSHAAVEPSAGRCYSVAGTAAALLLSAGRARHGTGPRTRGVGGPTRVDLRQFPPGDGRHPGWAGESTMFCRGPTLSKGRPRRIRRIQRRAACDLRLPPMRRAGAIHGDSAARRCCALAPVRSMEYSTPSKRNLTVSVATDSPSVSSTIHVRTTRATDASPSSTMRRDAISEPRSGG